MLHHAQSARMLVSLLLTGLLSACAGPQETYTVLPGADGQAGSLTIQPRQGQAVEISGAYASAVVHAGRSAERITLTPQEIQTLFSEALSAKPDAPVRFTLYFKEGSDELTPASQADFAQVLAAVKLRPAPDVVVVGHTDRVGLLADNDRLALRRAEKLRLLLIEQGLPADSIQAAGRGEREPLVKTADEVQEPRNRRVEMLVR